MPDKTQLPSSNTDQMENEDEPPLGLFSILFDWGNRVVSSRTKGKSMEQRRKMASFPNCCPRSAIGLFHI